MEAHDEGLDPAPGTPGADPSPADPVNQPSPESSGMDTAPNITPTDGALSIMDQVREQREELKQEGHHLDLDVPGYAGMLVARYIPVRFEVIEKLAKNANRDKSGVSKNLLASIDTVIEACQEVLLRVNGELQPIPDPSGTGLPIAYESRLATALGFEANTSREVVAGLFPNEFGVIDHNVRYSRWLRDVTKEVDDDLLGE